MATIRLVNSGVFDRHPRADRAHGASLRRHRRHAVAGALLSGARGVQGDLAATHAASVTPKHDFDHYIRNNLVFDTAGIRRRHWRGQSGSVRNPCLPHRLSATDYPQEIRKREIVRDFRARHRALGADGERILSGNVGCCLNVPGRRNRCRPEVAGPDDGCRETRERRFGRSNSRIVFLSISPMRSDFSGSFMDRPDKRLWYLRAFDFCLLIAQRLSPESSPVGAQHNPRTSQP